CYFFQEEDGIRDLTVTGVQPCALPIFAAFGSRFHSRQRASRNQPAAGTEAGWLRLARWRLWNRDPKAAKDAAEKALALNPKSAEIGRASWRERRNASAAAACARSRNQA